MYIDVYSVNQAKSHMSHPGWASWRIAHILLGVVRVVAMEDWMVLVEQDPKRKASPLLCAVDLALVKEPGPKDAKRKTQSTCLQSLPSYEYVFQYYLVVQ